jgi:hypothetical protein
MIFEYLSRIFEMRWLKYACNPGAPSRLWSLANCMMRAFEVHSFGFTSSPPMWKYGSGKIAAISPMNESRNWYVVSTVGSITG